MDVLTRTWLLLIGLTAVTALLGAADSRLAVIGLLLAAWAKARLILGRFLHLAAAPSWLSAFTAPLAIWLSIIGGVYVLVLG